MYTICLLLNMVVHSYLKRNPEMSRIEIKVCGHTPAEYENTG
jgi:hypothetical protein